MLLPKDVYSDEFMDSLKKFKESLSPKSEKFYSSKNLKNIPISDYNHAKTAWNNFEMEDFRYCYDFYIKSDTSSSSNIFEIFRDMCLKTYNLDLTQFYYSHVLAWFAVLKKNKTGQELLTDNNMLLMNQKGITGRICHTIVRHLRVFW